MSIFSAAPAEIFQSTLRRPISVSGIGLQATSGAVRVRLLPASGGSGVRFRRTDLGTELLPTPALVKARPFGAALSDGSTTIASPEHLLAALSGLGIDNVTIEMDGEEVPQMDGSAVPWVYLLREAGIRRLRSSRRYIRVHSRSSILTNDAVSFSPYASLGLDVTAPRLKMGLSGTVQRFEISEAAFEHDLAPARRVITPVDMERLRMAGIRPSVIEQLFAVAGHVLPRFIDEANRHRALRAIGDLALLGYPVQANVSIGGNVVYGTVANRFLSQPECWDLVDPSGEIVPISDRPAYLNQRGAVVKRVELVHVSEQLLSLLRRDPRNLQSLDADGFERLVCHFLDRMGLGVQRVGSVYSADGGIDIVAWPLKGIPFLLAVQAKHHRSQRRKTGPEDVRSLIGVMDGSPFQAGMIVTNTTFTPSAAWAAKERGRLIKLRDMNDLSRWLSDSFMEAEDWREIPTRIELGPDLVIRLPHPGSDSLLE